MAELIQAELVKKEQLKPDIFKFCVKAETIVKNAKPGHFVEIRVTNQTEPFLRRPISIYSLNKENGILEFIFQVKGKGTEILSQRKEGENIDIMGPLGFGTFKIENYKNIAIIGGGIGIFPLYELAKQATEAEKLVNTYLGFRNKEYVTLEEEFKKVSNNLTITTDDGTYKEKGFAIDFLKQDLEKQKIDCIYACGPLPMLKAVQQLSLEKGIDCQISLEQRMACGIGACLGCAVKKAQSPQDAPEYYHVCKGGPVFQARDVEI